MPLPEDVEAEVDQLREEFYQLSEADHDNEEDTTAAEARMQVIEARLEEIESMTLMWPDEAKACLTTKDDVRWTMTREQRAGSAKRAKPTVAEPTGLF